MAERRIDLPPHRFWVRTEGDGEPLVLIHGLSGSSKWWNRNIDALAARYEVSAVDLVGFGRNRGFLGSELPLPFEEIAALLGRWIEAELRAPVHLAGHSMGGVIALTLAAARPDLVRTLTLVSAAGIPFRLDPRPHLTGLRHPPAGLVSFAPRLAADALRAGPTSIALASAQLLRLDAREAMRLVRAPTLLVWGESDPLVPLRYAEEMLAALPEARLAILPRAGHVPMWDEPEAFNEVLLQFLGEGRAASRPGYDVAGEDGTLFQWAIRDCAGGICWRQSGTEPRVVLIHGLGIGSRYFHPLARALHARGIDAVAPDLPGLGFSDPAPADRDLESAAGVLLEWSRAAGVRDAVWLGHSTGAQLVAALARAHPGEVPRAVFLSPVWTRRSWPWVRLPLLLAFDATREPFPLIAEAVRAYWASGLLTIARDVFAYRRRIEELPLPRAHDTIVFGARDPLVDRGYVAESRLPVREIGAAHGAPFSAPEEIAAIVAGLVAREPSPLSS